MEESNIESKNSDFQNIFVELLGESNANILGDLKTYIKSNPRNVVFLAEIYNKSVPVWKGQIDLTKSEEALRAISKKLETVLNLIDLNDNKVVVAFITGKTIIGLDFKNTIKRNMETKKLVNIYSKK